MSRSRVPGRISEPMAITRRLRAELKAANVAMFDHAKHCYACHNAISITAGYCDVGWPLAKRRARAIYNWDNRVTISARESQSDTLF